MVRSNWPGRVAIALLGAALAALCRAQPAAPTTESEARYYVYGAFLTHAVPEIMGRPVTLGPELEQQLGLPAGADRQRIYDALMRYTDGKRIAVRKASAEDLAGYKRKLKQPVFRVEAGEIALLVEYDMKANTIPFVGQLAVAEQPPQAAAAPAKAAPPVVVAPAPKPAAPVVAVAAPKPAPKPSPVRAAPPPAAPRAQTLKPNGPCLVKPVMSEQDLANCRTAPAAHVDPGPPALVRAPAPAAPPARRTGPCEVKPVMSEEDLANCRNVPSAASTARGASAPAAAHAKPPTPTPAARKPAAPCVIKPVMSEEDLAACR